MSKLPPRQPGFYLFKGERHIKVATYERIHVPLQVLEHTNGRVKEMAVRMIGKREMFPIGNFEGEWIVIELERTAA